LRRSATKLFFTATLLTLSQGAFAQARPSPDFSGDPRMGTCTHFAQGWDPQKFMPLVEKSGIGWIRDDLGWEGVEKQKGEYHIPDKTLAWIHAAHANHVRLLLILNGENKLYADRYDPQAFGRWAAWVATELKSDVDAIEILNEPNNFGFSKYYGGQHDGEGDSPWVSKYVTLMNTAAEAIKAANPAMPVIGFGAGPAVTYKQLALGTSPAVDGLVDHPYSNQALPEFVPGKASEQVKKFGFAWTDERGTFASLIDGFQKQSEQHHGPKQIWLTEWGFSTWQPLTEGMFGGFTESAQAKYILRRFVEGFGLGVDVSFLYDFRDDHAEDDHNAENRWGLVRANGEPKESFGAVVNLVDAMRGLRAAKSNEAGQVNVFPGACWPQQAPVAVYRFVDAQGRPAAAIWATDPAGGDRQPRVADIELLWGSGDGQVIAVDTLTGKSETVPFERKGARLVKSGMTLRDYPVLLKYTGPALAAGDANDHKDIGERPLGLLDKGAHWGFSNGQEFPGATGSLEQGTDGDKPVINLSYDFTKGGAYVAALSEISIPDTAAEIRIPAKSPRGLGLSIQLIDRTGQCHQFVRSVAGTGEWEAVRLAMDQKASEHWGGANDGKLHFPIRKMAINVRKPAGEPAGKVEFGDPVMISK
jgi:hypothetical protein